MIRRLGLALMAVACVVPSQGKSQTLNEALIAAYGSNPTLAAQRARLRATDEGVPQALANWRPDVALTTDIARSHTDVNTRTTTSRGQIRSPRGAEFNVTQPLFRGFRTRAEVRQAEFAIKAERSRLENVEQNILVDVATVFMDVVRDQAVLALNVNNEQVLTRQLEATRDRFQVGENTRTDVHQAEARLAGATADRTGAEGDLEASRAAYLNVVGQAPGNLVSPKPGVDLPETKGEAMQHAREYHPNARAARFDEKSAQQEVVGIRGELLPSLSLVGKLSRDFESTSNVSRADEGSITANLSIPIFQKGAVYSRLRQARQTVGEFRLLAAQAERNAVEAATRTWESLSARRAQITSFAAQVKASEVALEGVQREAQVGSRTVLDVLDAEQELLDAKVNLVRAQRDEIVAVFELKSAIGELTARHLNLDVDYYDPENHYREVRGKWAGGRSSGEPAATDGGAAKSE